MKYFKKILIALVLSLVLAPLPLVARRLRNHS